MTPSRVTSSSPSPSSSSPSLLNNRRTSQLLLAALLLILNVALVSASPATSAKTYDCPRGCDCNVSTIVCSSVQGLRSIDKSLPIKRLVLSGLDLTKIPAQLENVRNLTELDLSDNHLSEVNHLGKRIRKLDLSQNRITSGKLSKVPPYVESLNLSHNEITYLPLHLMKLKKLRSIELANNPINCTCETLHIRNWLTTRHVWSSQHIKCNAPPEFKGRPWLQVKQADVCHVAAGSSGRTGDINWDDYEDENDLMLGDQPDLDDGDEEEEDDYKKEYLPVGEKVKPQDPPIDIQNDDSLDEGSGFGGAADIGEEEKAAARKVVDVALSEGSGEEGNETAVHVAQIQNAMEVDEEDDDGSGSGAGILIYGSRGIGLDHASEEPEVVPTSEESGEEKPFTPPGLGIFGKGIEESTTAATSTEAAQAIVPLGEIFVKTEDTTEATESPAGEGEQRIDDQTKTADDSQATYILLAILAIILICLIILVMCKRKPDARNRRGKADLEAARGREMQDMDKSLLGKPLEKNGHNHPPERMPLMNDRDKSDYQKVMGDKPTKPERTSLEKPPLESFKPVPADRNKSKESLYENMPPNNNNTVPHANGNGPVGNGDPAGVHQPNVPSSQDGEGFQQPNGSPNHLLPEPAVESPKTKRYSPIYVPTSPKSDRYSPVYSPETGRVKIKLTETPKPKTPILVTRSRSRAGDYITTPDQKI